MEFFFFLFPINIYIQKFYSNNSFIKILSFHNRYRPLKANKDELRKIICEFIQSQNYEKTYKKLMGGDWGARLPHTKSKQQQINLENHVS